MNTVNKIKEFAIPALHPVKNIRQPSIPFSQSQLYFEAKAHRYLAAMKYCAKARLSELAPFWPLIPEKASRLIDLLGGNGFVSEFIGDNFDHILLTDNSNAMLPDQTDSRRILKSHAGTIDLMHVDEVPYDMAVCLAGFHHLLPAASKSQNYDLTHDIRQKTINSWCELLNPGGRLVIVDVPASGSSINDYIFNEREVTFLRKHEPAFAKHLPADTLSCGIEPEPALFFDCFVKSHCPYGHEGLFESQNSLQDKLRNSGLYNVGSCIRYVPWLFPSAEVAMWFISELFAIGDENLDPAPKLDQAKLSLINEAVENHLGRHVFPDGTCLIHWKLLYAWGDKPNE